MAVDYFVLSQFKRVTDRQTDGQTDRKATARPVYAFAIARS